MKSILTKMYSLLLVTLFTLFSIAAPVYAANDGVKNGIPLKYDVYIVATVIAVIVIIAFTTTNKKSS